jgi:serine/threonine-protein kinase
LFQPGQSFGKFYLVQLLGEGGTSRIFKAIQQPISRIVALKIPSFDQGGSILTPDEFLSEATLMARLEHGNIVRIYDFGVQEDKAFICMEYVEGKNLQELVAERHPLANAAVLAIACQTLEALLYSHSQDVLHLDLSPANVLIAKQGTVKLSDFGMAGKKPRPGEGKVVGTPAFLSPEHVAGTACTARSDLFSFGSLLYYACLGEFLFDPGPDCANLGAAFAEIESARAHPPAEKLRRLPAPIAALVRKALEGVDGEGLLADLKALWAKSEGETRPEAALRRELRTGEDSPAAESEGGAGSEEALRERYLKLRESGRHREAVALLEKALRRRPDHPLLQELIAAPPAKVKSDLVTVEVGVPAGKTPAKSRRPAWWLITVAAAILGTLAVTAARMGRQPAAAHAVPAPVVSPLPSMPVQVPVAAAPAPTAEPSPQATLQHKTPRAHKQVAAAPVVTEQPPALGLSGPAFTRVILNDSMEMFSPSPDRGWTVPAGLTKIVLSRPNSKESITSSLFMSPDTFYLIRMEEDGGFSVSRRRR